jgi:hypothetical protein
MDLFEDEDEERNMFNIGASMGSICVGLGCWDGFVFMQHVLVFFCCKQLVLMWAKFLKELWLNSPLQAT